MTFGGGVMSTLVGMKIPRQLFQLTNGCDITLEHKESEAGGILGSDRERYEG